MEIKEKYAAKFEKIELGEYVYLFEDINLWLDRKKDRYSIIEEVVSKSLHPNSIKLKNKRRRLYSPNEILPADNLKAFLREYIPFMQIELEMLWHSLTGNEYYKEVLNQRTLSTKE